MSTLVQKRFRHSKHHKQCPNCKKAMKRLYMQQHYAKIGIGWICIRCLRQARRYSRSIVESLKIDKNL